MCAAKGYIATQIKLIAPTYQSLYIFNHRELLLMITLSPEVDSLLKETWDFVNIINYMGSLVVWFFCYH